MPGTDSKDSAQLATGGRQGYLRIATEEAFCPRELMHRFRRELQENATGDLGFHSLWSFYGGDSERARLLAGRIQDLGERRLADMDAAGIDHQLIALTCPGVQIFEPAEAVALAVRANDELAEACRRHPARFSGLAAIAPQDPQAAARELERGVRELGLRGAIVNSHTRGEYLDDEKFWPIFEAAAALDVPIYLHPNTPSNRLIEPFLERGLDGAIYGFAVETGLHLLRLITAGVFDRFPQLKLVVGHLGEALPFWMSRIDFMHGASVRAGRTRTQRLELAPSAYLRRNVWFTTSGMAWAPAVMFVRTVVGGDRVLYAMDYPYQYVADEVHAMDALPITPAEKQAFFQGTAEMLFGLGADRLTSAG
jgi:5-carboxyvanillate decarboxylase